MRAATHMSARKRDVGTIAASKEVVCLKA